MAAVVVAAVLSAPAACAGGPEDVQPGTEVPQEGIEEGPDLQQDPDLSDDDADE